MTPVISEELPDFLEEVGIIPAKFFKGKEHIARGLFWIKCIVKHQCHQPFLRIETYLGKVILGEELLKKVNKPQAFDMHHPLQGTIRVLYARPVIWHKVLHMTKLIESDCLIQLMGFKRVMV